MNRVILIGHALLILVGLCAFLLYRTGAPPSGLEADQAPGLREIWRKVDVAHQPAARQVTSRGGYLYVAGGGATAQVAKVRIADGSVAWSRPEPGQTYHPSYPVSNGDVVVLGRFSGGAVIGLDDATGNTLWTVPTGDQVMGGARFSGDLVFIGCYDRYLYAIDWRKGEVRWRAPLEGRCWSTPVLWRDQVIVGAYDGCLHGFDRSTGKAALVIECGGAVKSDPVVVGDLAFVAVDEGVYRGDHDSARVRNILQVIDLSNESILETFRTAPRFRFGPKIVHDGDQVFFFDNTSLFAYDLRSRTTVWKLEAPQGLLPWPIIRGSRVVLAMNLIGYHGEHTSTLMTVDRETGTDARHRADGGVPATMPTYIVEGSHLVMAAGSLVGYHMNLR